MYWYLSLLGWQILNTHQGALIEKTLSLFQMITEVHNAKGLYRCKSVVSCRVCMHNSEKQCRPICKRWQKKCQEAYTKLGALKMLCQLLAIDSNSLKGNEISVHIITPKDQIYYKKYIFVKTAFICHCTTLILLHASASLARLVCIPHLESLNPWKVFL